MISALRGTVCKTQRFHYHRYDVWVMAKNPIVAGDMPRNGEQIFGTGNNAITQDSRCTSFGNCITEIALGKTGKVSF